MSMSLPARLWNSARVWSQMPRERRLPFWPLERIAALQAQRVRRIAAWAYRTVPYYRRTLDALDLRPGDFRCAGDLAHLPILDGATVRSNVEDFTSHAIPPRRRIEQRTSGTSSTALRKLLYWDEAAYLAKMAVAERDRPVLAEVLLNYRLGDWGRLASEPCPCGSGLPLLQSLGGRRDELFFDAPGAQP